MRVFLTGGTGFLGGHVARALLVAGHEVLALARSRDRAARVVGCGARFVEGDLLEPAAWEATLGECEALVHAAAMVKAWSPEPAMFDRVNVAGALRLLELARGAGIERLVVTSSLFVLGPARDGVPRTESALEEPISPVLERSAYARTKAVLSRRIRELQRQGEPVMMLFPTVLVGAGGLTDGNHTARVMSDVGRRRLPGLVGSGDQTWNLVGVEDAARAHVLALERGVPGRNYVIAGEDWTQRRLVETAARLFGVRPPRARLGRRGPLALAALAESLASLTGREPFLTRGEVDLYVENWMFRADAAAAQLGFEAQALDEVVESTVSWIRDEIWPRRRGRGVMPAPPGPRKAGD